MIINNKPQSVLLEFMAAVTAVYAKNIANITYIYNQI